MCRRFIGLILDTKKIKDRTPTHLGDSYSGPEDSGSFRTCCRLASVESLSCTTATCLSVEGLRKQEMTDCKYIKILLAICPSSHRSEDLLPIPEVLWNPRLSHVSFLLILLCAVPVYSILGFLSLPLRWAFFMFSFHRGRFC